MTTPAALSIQYPRKPWLRGAMRLAGRAAFALLSRTTVTGVANLPPSGPLILVGNHVAVIEAAMMVVFAPWLVELLGTGEIPLDPSYAWIIHQYGFIPIRRGDMDREALTAALDVLKQNGVVGIFPEGGIWESKIKKARTGVAWLSYQSGAPLVPIGFGGVDGALKAALAFQRPKMTMNIGQVIPPVTIDTKGQAKKDALQAAANMIMGRVADLIPEEDKARWNRIRDERFEMQFVVTAADGSALSVPPELLPHQPALLSKFFHRPLLLDVLTRNLQLPVHALQDLHTEHDAAKLAAALEIALGYYTGDNPHFLSYRFGYDEAGGMLDGLQQLRLLAHWAAERGAALHVIPIRHFRRKGSEEVVTERRVGELPAL